MPAGVTGTSVTGNATSEAKTVNFGEITYKDPGTYAYTITEVNGGVAGVTYDTTEHSAVVTVAAGTDGELTASVKYDEKTDPLTITNTYHEVEAKAELEATKSFSNWGEADSFTFTLTAVNGAPMPAGVTGTSISKNATEANPTVNFGSITYKSAGTYAYTITEVDSKVPGVTYDKTSHSAVVIVAAGTDGELTATVKYDGNDSLTITNTYNETTATLQATKSFNNWGKASSFTFNLAALNGAPMPATSTATATASAPTASFGAITYNKAGTYEYTSRKSTARFRV